MHRRTVLGAPVLGLLGLTLAACGEDSPVTPSDIAVPEEGAAPEPRRISYGEDASQWGDLYLPDDPRGVVVVIHGGFWLAEYDYTYGEPLAVALAAQGWATWNLEYRRVGDGPGGGGGDPATFYDVAAGIDLLADLGPDIDLDLTTVIALGHSAGGHLATWAASRGRFEQWAGGVDLTHVISQAGVLDLIAGDEADLGGGAVATFLGHSPGPDDAPLDPIQQVPLDVPVWCVHATDDRTVPIGQSQSYVMAATGAGATAELVEVAGDHFVLIDPTSEAWARTVQIFDSIG
ncbi:alpha/beta hydrolase [soil metagenome]